MLPWGRREGPSAHFHRPIALRVGRGDPYASRMKRTLALLVGVGILSGCSALGSAQPSPKESATVTVTASPTGLPAECSDALDQADAAVSSESSLAQDLPQAVNAMREAIAAAGRMDLPAVQAQTQVIEKIDAEGKAKAAQDAAAKYQTAVQKCRALRS